MAGTEQLLEREFELEQLSRLVSATAGAEGGMLLLAGEAGIGKSSLLAATGEMARDGGLRVLTARGGELERDIAFGAVRQMFERTVAGLPSSQRQDVVEGAATMGARVLGNPPMVEARSGGDLMAAIHGLYWLLANLAEVQPVCLLIDDAQWADSASLRWLVYLSSRLGDIPVAVAVGVRLHDPRPLPKEAELLLAQPSAVLYPRPLSGEATAAVVAGKLGGREHTHTSDICSEVTGGNPFLVTEFCDAVSRMASQEYSEPDLLRRVGPQGVARNVLVRVAAAGRDAVALAQAVAVAGMDVDLKLAAELGGLELDAARSAADVLCRSEILTAGGGLSFVHPLVRSAIYEDVTPARRAALHRRAGELWAAFRAGSDRVSAHLVLSERAGDRWVAEQLLSAGARALEMGAPAEAVRLLERARAEPPPEDLREQVSMSLGAAHLAAGELDLAADRFAGGTSEATNADGRLRAAMMQAMALAMAGRASEAATRLRASIDAAPDASEAVQLRAWLELVVLTRGFQPLDEEGTAVVDALSSRRIDEALLEGRLVLGAIAFDRVFRNQPAKEAVDLVRRARADELPDDGDLDYHAYPVVAVLIHTDHLDEAESLLAVLAGRARRRGSLPAAVIADSWISYACLRAGKLRQAEAVATRALELGREAGVAFGRFLPALVLASVHLEKGSIAEAEELLAEAEGHGMGGAGWAERIGVVRGQLALASGDGVRALDILLQVGRALEGTPLVCPAVVSWRSLAALAAASVGSGDEAKALATEEVELARAFGAPRAVATALHALGCVTQGPERTTLLQEAAEVADEGPDRLLRARILADLGLTLMELENERARAREMLALAAGIASRCGSEALGSKISSALGTGGRSRGREKTGPGSLSPGERRVADLAARGVSNRQIAQELFLSRRTVEWRLYEAYRKLGIGSRKELSSALEG